MIRKKIALITAVTVTAVALTGAAAVAMVGVHGGSPGATAPTSTKLSADADPTPRTGAALATSFFRDWVKGGRVIRRDQGSDTVSEGQAYGLLIAAGTHNEKEFAAIWSWTKTHLMRSDGLLAWRWQNGKVVDSAPASDADLDAARALLVAGDQMHHPEWTAAGTKLSDVIVDRLSVQTVDARILLPGLWAATTEPYAYNPSYASPAAFAVIGKYTKDPRWAELVVGSRAVTNKLLQKSALPPDWAQVKADGTVDAMPGARGSGQSVRYSYDAARVALRYAESCAPEDQELAARLAAPLGRDNPLSAQLDLGAGALTTDQHPIGYLARAAARAAGHDDTAALSDLRKADSLAAATPTYYGSAWTALAPLYLGSTALGGCPLLSHAANPGGGEK